MCVQQIERPYHVNPTCVGMDRITGHSPEACSSKPHVRGDGPKEKTNGKSKSIRKPHVRGDGPPLLQAYVAGDQ